MFNWFFGRKSIPEKTPAPVDYEALFDEVMTGLAVGWSTEQVKTCLAGRENDQRFVEWLFRYDREVLQVEPERRQQMAARLVMWGDMDCGVVGQMVREMGQQAMKPEQPDSEPELSVLGQRAKELFTQGYDAYSQGDFLGAITAYDQVLAIKPDDHNAFLNKGNSLINLGRYQDAIDAYDQALSIKPDHHIAPHNKGVSLENLGRYQDAIDAYDQALSIKPDHAALYGKGNSLSNLGRYQDAIDAYDQALSIKPDYHTALSSKGASLSNLGRYQDAIDAYDQALSIKPDYHTALSNKGSSLYNLGRYQDAIDAYDQALAIKPDYYIALYNKGVSQTNLGRYQDAIDAYDQVLAIKPDYHLAWTNRASAICNLGRLPNGHSNLSSHFQGQSIPALKAVAEPHIAALEEALPHVPQGSVGWGHLHLSLGNAYLEHSKQKKRPFPYWREAQRSYLTAANILSPNKFQEEHLEILQGLVRVELAFENIPVARDYQQQGRTLFEQLRVQKPERLKPEFERKFASFVQLEIDLLIGESNPISALEQAEFYKNRCLTWILDQWLDNPESPNFRAIQALVKPKTALVYWHLSHEQLTTFVLLPHQEQPIVIEADRAGQVHKLQSWLGIYNSEYRSYASKKAETEQRSRHPWRLHLNSLLDQLKQILTIETILKELPTDTEHIILIPHRDLHRLPLHTFFSDTLTTYLPSAQIGLALKSGETAQSPKPPLLVESPIHQNLAPLLFADLETALLNQLFIQRSLSPALIPYDQTTEQQLTPQFIQPRRLLHFTGHAAYDQHQPQKSALALQDTDLLTAKTIAALNLEHYDLVTLSACETAVTGTDTVATEYVGLVSAFLKAGAAKVLSTLWTVESRSNAWLMLYFYQAYLSGTPAPAALHQAQRWLRSVTRLELSDWLQQFDTPELKTTSPDEHEALITEIGNLKKASGTIDQTPFADPYYWAAFTLTGYSHESD